MKRMRGTTKRSVKNDIRTVRGYLRIIESELGASDYDGLAQTMLELEGLISGLRSEIEHQTHDEHDYRCEHCHYEGDSN